MSPKEVNTERLDILENPRAERVRRVAGLARRSARLRYGLLLVEGPQAVREALRHASAQVRDVYFSATAAQRYPELVEQAREVTSWVHSCTDIVANAISRDAQGVLAVVRAESISGRLDAVPDLRLAVVLPRTQDPGNAGTIIRTADAMGAGAVVACPGGIDVTSPKVIRASAGSVFHLPIVMKLPLEKAVAVMHDLGGVVVGTAGDAVATLDDLVAEANAVAAGRQQDPALLAGPIAWVFGNEAQGLTEAEELACDLVISIPMYGQAESLNVGTAAAICLSATARAIHAKS